MDNKANFSIIWKHFEKDSPTGEHLKATKDFSLPYFIEGEEKVKFEKKEPLDLNPLHLVKGLLVAYFDKPPKIDTAFAQQKAAEIINEHLPAFKAPGLEGFILNVANYLRDAHGSVLSLQALMTGIELLDDNNAIKYDACIDMIHCIDDELLGDHLAAVQQLKLILSKIDVKKLNPDMRKDYAKMIEIANEY